MNTRKLLDSIFLLTCVLLTACASPTPTSVPVIQATSTVQATYTVTGIAPTNTLTPTATQVVLGVVTGRIAFQSNRDGNNEIYVMNGDGSGLTNLTNNPAWDADPTWSPDSKQIAFVPNRDGGGFQIYVMNPDDGSGLTRLPNNRPIGTYNSFPNWSHDGAHIVFQSRDNEDSFFQIYVMSAYGDGEPVQLTFEGDNESPEWSPDDSLIAFSTNRDGNYEIYIMNAEGGDLTRLTNNSVNDISPAWQPR